LFIWAWIWTDVLPMRCRKQDPPVRAVHRAPHRRGRFYLFAGRAVVFAGRAVVDVPVSNAASSD
jgi:hypothetical protein